MVKKSNLIVQSLKFRKNIKKTLIFLTLSISLLLAVCASTLLFIIFKNLNEPPTEKIFKRSLRSVVEVKAYTENVGESFGTAEFIDKEGTLVTNAHVVTYTKLEQVFQFEKCYIRFAEDEHYIQVEIIKYNKELDIAVLKMNKDFHSFEPLKLGDSSKLETGNKIYAMGNLANYGISLTEGMVSLPLVNIEYNNVTKSVIQCNIDIAEGNSGGALLNQKGELIGITTFRTKDSGGNVIYGISYCIPINAVLEYIKN